MRIVPLLAAMEAIKLAVVFLLIVLALRRKIAVGLVLLGAGLVTALLFQVPFGELMQGYYDLLGSRRFLFLISVVILITMMGSLLKELGFLERMAEASQGLPGGRRTAAAVMPPLIGLMPMPGGSLLSAPLVANVMADKKYPPDLRTATNYWFRHMVEFFWLIYAGLILTEAITGMPLGEVSLMQFPMTLAMVIIGYFFFLRRIDPSSGSKGKLLVTVWNILRTIWPIALAVGLYGLLNLELALSVLLSIIVLVAVARPSRTKMITALKAGLSYKLVLLIFGILSFQTVLELAGAIETIPHLAAAAHLPAEVVIFLVCFAAGLLTGLVAAYVAMGYTILAVFLYQPVYDPGYIFLAYLSGYIGIMLSPSHLCLILTNEYFGSDLGRLYRRLVPPLIVLFLVGVGVYLAGWPELFSPN
jgi:hypothetical protein